MKTIRYSLIALIAALLGFAAVPAAEAGLVKRLVGYDHCGYPVYSYVYVRDHYRGHHYVRPHHRSRYVRRPFYRGYRRPVSRDRAYGHRGYVRSRSSYYCR